MKYSGRSGHFDGIMLYTAATKCGDRSEWSSLVKKTTQPEVTSTVSLAEMIKSKLPGKVCCHQNRIFFPNKDYIASAN